MKIPALILILFTTPLLKTSTAFAGPPQTHGQRKAVLKVCHVSSSLSNILPRANDLNLRGSGFKLKIEEYNARHANRIEFVFFEPASSQIALLDGIKRAAAEHCTVVVGLVSSRDAVIAAPFLQKLDLIGVSSTATATQLNQWHHSVVTLAASQESQAKNLLKTIRSSSKKGDIFVVTQRDDFYSFLFANELSTLEPSVRRLQLEPGYTLSKHDLSALSASQVAAIIYSTYPILSIPSLKQLSTIQAEKQKNFMIFGTSPWLETQIFKAKQSVLKALSEIKVLVPWDNEVRLKAVRQHFLHAYLNRYGAYPDHDSIYDYDAMSMIIECFGQENLRQCLGSSRIFTGILGKYLFQEGLAHPQRPMIMKDYLLGALLPLEIRSQKP